MIKYKLYEWYLSIVAVIYRCLYYYKKIFIRKNDIDKFFKMYHWYEKGKRIFEIKIWMIYDYLLNLPPLEYYDEKICNLTKIQNNLNSFEKILR